MRFDIDELSIDIHDEVVTVFVFNGLSLVEGK